MKEKVKSVDKRKEIGTQKNSVFETPRKEKKRNLFIGTSLCAVILIVFLVYLGQRGRVKKESVGVIPPVRSTTAKPSAGDTFPPSFTNDLGMKFLYIKPGDFLMGSPASENKRDKDEKQHHVTLTKGFYMQTTELTQGQWKVVMGENPSNFKTFGDDCPVEQVSWNDVQEFIRKLNRMKGTGKYRLPTEAEWEYACRAGSKTPFSFGNCLTTDQANYEGNYPMPGCDKGQYRKTTVRVGSFVANDWGLYDMHGNVWEWCEDWYGDYPSVSVTDPTGPSSGYRRVARGGSWGSGARGCRSASRSARGGKRFTGGKVSGLGFRLAMDP